MRSGMFCLLFLAIRFITPNSFWVSLDLHKCVFDSRDWDISRKLCLCFIIQKDIMVSIGVRN